MTTIQDFKENAYQSVWDHAKRIFKPITVPVIIMVLVGFGIMAAVYYGFWSEYLNPILEDLEALGPFDIEARNEILFGAFNSVPNMNTLIGISLLFFVIYLGFLSWMLNLFLIISEGQVLGLDENLGDQFRKSLNNDVLKLFGAIILSTVLFLAAFFIVAFVAGSTQSMALMFISVLLVYIFSLRLVGVYPAIVHGKMSVLEAFSFSWKNITFKRALIAFFLIIAASILMGVVLLIVGYIVSLFGEAGTIIELLFNIVLNLFFLSLFIAILTGIFFRYADVEIDNGEANLEEHLVE